MRMSQEVFFAFVAAFAFAGLVQSWLLGLMVLAAFVGWLLTPALWVVALVFTVGALWVLMWALCQMAKDPEEWRYPEDWRYPRGPQL